MFWLDIKRNLCIFAAEFANKLLNLIFTPMTEEELEKQIRLKKKLLSDYKRLADAYYIDQETYWKNVDIVLEQLSALINKRKKSN